VGGCRLTVGGETKFACVDGPNLMHIWWISMRQLQVINVIKIFERQAHEETCNLLKSGEEA
jgi:ferredoxin--NADP+ reductase